MNDESVGTPGTTDSGSDNDFPSRAERAAIYRELHRDYLDRFNATRQIEWIVNGALWAGIVLVGGQLADHVEVRNWPCCSILLAGLAAGAIHFFVWMYPIQYSENADIGLIRTYRKYAHSELGDRVETVSEEFGNHPSALRKFAKSIPEREDKNLLNTLFGKMAWPIVECATTSILIWTVLFFLKFVEWKGKSGS
jgi:hypothetical protein